MGVARYAAVTTPELVGVLAWWGVVFVAPVLFIRRWWRRRLAGQQRVATGLPAGDLHPRVYSLPAHAPGESEGRSLRARGETRGDPSRARDAGRLSSETLGPLCRYVDFRRRLEVAVSELEGRLSVLPANRWRIEPYPLAGERGNTLLLLGETGVFVISATLAPGHWDDVVTVGRLARKVKALLPGYPGEVDPVICHPFSSLPPRVWYREGEEGTWIGAWVVGGDSVLEWLEHFDPEHGLTPADLERFDKLSKPNWLKPAIPGLATWPRLPDPPRRHSWA